MKSRIQAALLAGLLVLTACSSASDDASTAAPVAALDERFADFALQDETQWNNRQEHIQLCMAAEGFDYLARPFVAEAEASLSGFARPIVTGEGYELSAWVTAQRQQLATPIENPNSTLVALLTNGERLGWAEAYGGSGTRLDWPSLVLLDDATGNPIMTNEAPNRGGCVGAALQDVGSPHFLEPLSDELEMIVARLESNPDIASAEQAWSLCMAESGHRYISPRTLFADLQHEALQLAFTDMSLDEFTTRELAVASADLACRTSTTYGATAEAADEKFATEVLGLLDSAAEP